MSHSLTINLVQVVEADISSRQTLTVQVFKKEYVSEGEETLLGGGHYKACCRFIT